MATTKYDVFISYSRKDYVDAQGHVIKGNTVSKIKDALTEAGITYWFDEDGIYSGDNFTEKIAFNIMNADIFVFISSASSNSSEWTSKEIATAHEFKRRIIPIRIDDSPYNIKVMFRIADIDYIDYYNNPDKGIDDLIRSITTYKEQLEEMARQKQQAEQERAERERRRREEDERRRIEEQKQLIESIKIQCAKLNGEETKIDIDRKGLLLSLSKVADKEQQAQLKQLIETSSLAHKKAEEKNAIIIKQLDDARKQLDEAQKSSQEVANLKSQLNEKSQTIAQLQSQLSTTQGELESTQGELETTKDELEALQDSSPDEVEKKSNKKLHYIYGGIITLLSLLTIGTLIHGCNRSHYSGDLSISCDSTEVDSVKDMKYVNPVLGKYFYTGKIVNDKPSGHGKAVFLNGDTFEGKFENGDIIEGTYRWTDGNTWTGRFENNEPVETNNKTK